MNNDEIMQLVSILSIAYPKEVPEQLKETPIYEKIKDTKFPDFDNSNFDIFSIDPENMTEISFTEALKDSHFNFPFQYDVLEFFKDYKTNNDSVENFIGCYSLCSFISWVRNYEETHSFDNIFIIYNALYRSIVTANFHKSISAFLILQNIYVQSKNFDNKKVFDIYSKIFELDKEMYMLFSSSFIPLLAKFFESNDENHLGIIDRTDRIEWS